MLMAALPPTRWDYLPMSDSTVIRQLIEYRYAFDPGYKCHEEWAVQWNLPSAARDHFDEDVILTYLDLDDLIERQPLDENERKVIILRMMGYNASDISAYGIRRDISRVSHLYDSAVEKLRKQAETDWYVFHGATKDAVTAENATNPVDSGDI